MKQITIKDMFDAIDMVQKRYKIPFEELMNIPVYIGDDEELNGVHQAYFCNEATNKTKNEDIKYLYETIKDYDETAKDICLLIS